MLGLSLQAARVTWTVFVVCAALAVLYWLRDTVVLFMAALFFAYVLWPAVSLIERHTPKWMGRVLALTIVYLLFVGVVVLLVITVGSRMVEEGTTLAQQVPDLMKNRQWLDKNLPDFLGPAKDKIIDWIQDQFASGGAALLPYLKNAGVALRGTVTGALYFILVPILAFFFIKDGREISEYLVSGVASPERRAVLDEILSDIHVLLGHYIRILVTLAFITWCVYSLFFTIVGVPYGILLASQAALLELIPVVGPLAGGAIAVLVAGFAGFPHLVWIIIFWGVYRMFQDYVVSPHLMGKGVEIHPLVVLFGVLAGERLGGVAGMFFSVPIIAIVRIVFVRSLRSARRRHLQSVVE
ncbi:MAG TPA: AI-2E family transporter [Bryobacteraceae bacterium]|nr:AI-2E family transporter [Bryobacteraceae bacterium]